MPQLKFVILYTLFLDHTFAQRTFLNSRREAMGADDFSRIIHGVPIDITDAPFQVSIEIRYQHACGGSLIHPTLIVTAAHCLTHITSRSRVNPVEMVVRVGTSKANTGGTRHLVERVEISPAFRASPDSGDIGLVLLKTPVKMTAATQIIGFSSKSPREGEMAVVTGYGSQIVQTKRNPPVFLKPVRTKSHLMAVQIPIYPRDKCFDLMLKLGQVVADDMLCAGYTYDNKDACKGDSGGPLIIDGRIVGITAWGIGCGQKGLPGIYTDVSRHLDWIEECSNRLTKRKTSSKNSSSSHKNHTS